MKIFLWIWNYLKMREIERSLPPRLLSYYKIKIQKDPQMLDRVYKYCVKIRK